MHRTSLAELAFLGIAAGAQALAASVFRPPLRVEHIVPIQNASQTMPNR